MQGDRESLRRSRNQRRRGAEMMEFVLAMLPLLIIMFAMIDISWSIFVKATLQYAVHAGLRQGITITGTQATAYGKTLTQMVKDTVQANSLGMLQGDTGRSYINVNFFAVDTSGNLVSANGVAGGNISPNLMQVSVDAYPLGALVPRIFGWAVKADLNPAMTSTMAADEIEPSNDVPAMGTTP